MELKEALQKSLKADKYTHKDSFLLHSRVSDLVGNDYESKKAAEEFYRLDAKYEISKTIIASIPVRYRKRKKRYYKINPMSLPRDNAYVYFDENGDTLHLSGECPCLNGASRIYRATYDHAKMLDFKRRCLTNRSWFYRAWHSESISRQSKTHKVHICRRCGNFISKTANGIFYKLARAIFNNIYIDLHRKINYSPTSAELFKSRATQIKEKIMKLFLYRRVKKYVNSQETVSEAKLQRKFKIGYGKAVMLIDRLHEDRRIMRHNNKWYVLGGVYNRHPDDVISISETTAAVEAFTEENVLKLLNEHGSLSASLIQRHFKVGYGKAATMIDTLAKKGYVKRSEGGTIIKT